MYASRGCSGECSKREARGGLRKDKGRSRSKNSIISADARTSLGFPGADNGALFEESFRATGIPGCCLFSLSSAFPLTHPPLPLILATCFRLLLLSCAGFLVRSVE